MLNYIWLALIASAVVMGGLNHQLKELNEAVFESAKTAVTGLVIPLIGVMALWLGLMRLAERSGLVQILARWMRPVLRWLFPDVPSNHPALNSIVMNFSANMLGLSNAATPLGLRAMKDLERLNPHPGTATNAMCTFLAVNTSSLQLIPTSTIAILAALGSKNPTAILGPALMATSISTLVGISSVKLLQNLPWFASPAHSTAGVPEPADVPEPPSEPLVAASLNRKMLTALLMGTFGLFLIGMLVRAFQEAPTGQPAFASFVNAVSLLAIPFVILFFVVFAALRGVSVYEEFVEGAKEGFETAVRVIPYLVAMLLAVGMFRAAGGVDRITTALAPILGFLHFPSELVPLSLMRPLSGSGANGIFAELVKTYGPDHLLSRMGGTLIGSTETTFYVLAVYFGSVGIKRVRHALAAGLIADFAGMIAAVLICRAVFA